MVQINFGRKEISCKIVFYGPGMSGKTTNLEVVHKKAPEQNRGDMTSISTDGDRTLFFDYMPLDLGTIAGMRTKFQMYTVPGQVYYNSTRKLVLQGVDGVIFVADSGPEKIKENLESFQNLEENLREYGRELKDLPHIIQCNKRDLPEAMSLEEMTRDLNKYNAPVFEAVAATGQGVFPTLKALSGLVLESINQQKKQLERPQGVAAPSQSVGAAPVQRGDYPHEGRTTYPTPQPSVTSYTASVAQKQHVVSQPMHHVSQEEFSVSPAARVSRAPVPTRSRSKVPTARVHKRQTKRRNNQLAFGLLFGFLVVAAAGGVVVLLVL